MITDPYTPEIVQETIRFTELYTRMGQQLLASLLTAEYIHMPEGGQEPVHIEDAIERVYEVDSLKPIWYKGQYWNIHLHGEHCRFASDSGLPIEVNMYDSSLLDASFFSDFLHHLPAAQVLVHLIKPADFMVIVHLFEYMTEQNLLTQINSTNFRAQPIE
ncbi:hypothetical protein [Paenibacillus bovis]|uniref:Uncharacterized protein n=1 Tax=Paenibacillus bovis TaxID=1616788 RepID=A0A172ZHL4_9BACL|nr:hypothetical protein [Paenibacillus bovis]ANF97125.1 hypothetical protein AR543_14685 [Paenibacillus bovis]